LAPIFLVLKLCYPVERDIMKNFPEMEMIWHNILYDQLKVKPEEVIIFLTEGSFNPKENRQKMTEIIFETFNAYGRT
jgi:actin beta/gamma 1